VGHADLNPEGERSEVLAVHNPPGPTASATNEREERSIDLLPALKREAFALIFRKVSDILLQLLSQLVFVNTIFEGGPAINHYVRDAVAVFRSECFVLINVYKCYFNRWFNRFSD
jgi:hypothetical protein